MFRKIVEVMVFGRGVLSEPPGESSGVLQVLCQRLPLGTRCFWWKARGIRVCPECRHTDIETRKHIPDKPLAPPPERADRVDLQHRVEASVLRTKALAEAGGSLA